jgi:hypothetical protein
MNGRQSPWVDFASLEYKHSCQPRAEIPPHHTHTCSVSTTPSLSFESSVSNFSPTFFWLCHFFNFDSIHSLELHCINHPHTQPQP